MMSLIHFRLRHQSLATIQFDPAATLVYNLSSSWLLPGDSGGRRAWIRYFCILAQSFR